MHDGIVVIGNTKVFRDALEEILYSGELNVFPVDIDVLIAIDPRLFVVETKSVAYFVDDYAYLKE